jgi:hypothetical protein
MGALGNIQTLIQDTAEKFFSSHRTDFYDVLGDNRLKEDLSIGADLDHCKFSLDKTYSVNLYTDEM